MKRKTAILLGSALLAAAVLASCGDASTAQNPANNDASADVQTEAVTEPVKEFVKADLPDRDFGGENFIIYGRIYDGEWSAYDILSKELDGEQINDALVERTRYIEETYNCTLETFASNESTVTAPLKKLITAGDATYAACVTDVYDAGSLSVDGLLLNLKNVENIDLSQRWWAQMTNASLTLDNRQYYATGDLFIQDNRATRVFFFNKGMVTNYDMESPYALVKANKWTQDAYFKMCETVKADLNGDNVMKREDDQFGTFAQTTVGGVLYLGAGQHFTEKDGNDLPYIACNTEKAVSVMTAISDKLSKMSDTISQNGDSLINGYYPDNLVYFQDGRGLFAPEVLAHIQTMRDCNVDIGILPPPKFDESQDGYYCYADGWCVNVVSVPVTNTSSEKIGFVLEAMAANALNNLTPAYYDICLTSKYVRDQESVEMLDLIFANVVMDNANIFSWGSIESTVNTAMTKGTGIASAIEKVTKATQKAMDKTVTALQEQD